MGGVPTISRLANRIILSRDWNNQMLCLRCVVSALTQFQMVGWCVYTLVQYPCTKSGLFARRTLRILLLSTLPTSRLINAQHARQCRENGTLWESVTKRRYSEYAPNSSGRVSASASIGTIDVLLPVFTSNWWHPLICPRDFSKGIACSFPTRW